MADQPVPPEIIALAEERSRARAAREWRSADELRGRIETAGWRIEDHGLAFRLSPARPPDLVEAGRTLYGSPDAVPSRSDEPDAPGATVVLIAQGPGSPIAAQLVALRDHLPVGTRRLVVADRETDPADMGLASEIIWMAQAWPAGAALRAGLRRVTSRVVVIVGERCVPVGDIVSPLVAALEDETIAIVGSAGLVSADLWHHEPGGFGEVTAVTADCYAFRRQDALERGEVDDHLISPGGAAAWLSLLLRDAGTSVPPRLALAIELPLDPLPTEPDGEQPPLARRDRYRIAERFKGRTDLTQQDATTS